MSKRTLDESGRDEFQQKRLKSHPVEDTRTIDEILIAFDEAVAAESHKTPVMRLFVWEGFCPDYTDGLAFAIAETLEHAQQLVVENKGYTPFDWGTLTEVPLTAPVAFQVSGGG